MPDLTFQESTGRFRGPGGQFVSEAKVRAIVDQIADHASQEMAAVSQSLLDGTTTLAAWETEMRRLVKVSNSATSVLANGGAAAMSPSRWGSVGQTVRQEYGYLHQMAQDIASGAQPLDGRLVSRARLYGQNARTTFENVRIKGDRARGFLAERNILSPGRNCAKCEGESARGWVPAGDLIPVGSRTCLSNCRCRVERRREAA